jgi:hypothetical protein
LTLQSQQVLLSDLEISDFVLKQIVVVGNLLVKLFNQSLQFLRVLILLFLQTLEFVLVLADLTLYFFI